MPEATVLYSVTAVVVAGLVVWVLAVLKTAKEPWARAAPPRSGELSRVEGAPDASAADPVAAAPADEVEEPAAADGDAAKLDADATARATPVALAGEAKPSEALGDEDSAGDAKKAGEAEA
ncbi:MAG: hypothetical protein KF764_24350 [Labilithrix sp.]|nr:hypothetical protein [Labilithrix sp.]MBX3223972.1 hypothetical protein [Labilithrix sp.]